MQLAQRKLEAIVYVQNVITIHDNTVGLWRHRARTADRAAAKGMMPLKPEENRWRRASFSIGTSYGTTPRLVAIGS